MSVNSTHPDYDAALPSWLRARDVIAGEDAVKSAGEKYLPRLEVQTDEEYDTTFERAMDRDEKLMAILGARLLETQKRVGEAAEATELKQSGENSILGALASSVGMSLTHVPRWAHWWNSTEAMPDDVSNEQVAIGLNTDYSTRGLSANEIVAVVQAWQNGALSRDSMLDIFRRGRRKAGPTKRRSG